MPGKQPSHSNKKKKGRKGKEKKVSTEKSKDEAIALADQFASFTSHVIQGGQQGSTQITIPSHIANNPAAFQQFMAQVMFRAQSAAGRSPSHAAVEEQARELIRQADLGAPPLTRITERGAEEVPVPDGNRQLLEQHSEIVAKLLREEHYNLSALQ